MAVNQKAAAGFPKDKLRRKRPDHPQEDGVREATNPTQPIAGQGVKNSEKTRCKTVSRPCRPPGVIRRARPSSLADRLLKKMMMRVAILKKGLRGMPGYRAILI